MCVYIYIYVKYLHVAIVQIILCLDLQTYGYRYIRLHMFHLFEGSLFQLYYLGVDRSRCGHVEHVSAVRKRAPGHADFSRIVAPIRKDAI